MMYSRVYWLLLLVITAGVKVDCEVYDIQWEAGCNSYHATTELHPRMLNIHYETNTRLSQCRSFCTGRTDCGGFRWDWDWGGCWLININDQIIEQYLSQNWYRAGTGTWYSKMCDYDVGNSDLSCNSYTDRQYHNQRPAYKWMITENPVTPNLTATECQAWCTLYTGCRSVEYIRYNIGDGACLLYDTTIQDLLDSGLADDVKHETDTDRKTVTTYDRYCGDGSPYEPDQK